MLVVAGFESVDQRRHKDQRDAEGGYGDHRSEDELEDIAEFEMFIYVSS